MKKFNGKYRIPSARAPWWDYGANGSYFVTICTKHRIHYFGRIVDGQMVLSEIGRAADACWRAIPDHFPFVRLGEHIVMPDHMHGIITIDKTDPPPSGNMPTPKNKFGPQSKNLASIIRGYKIGVTKIARTIDPDFAWQPRYHDRIIRDAHAYAQISRYIIRNPENWRGR